MQEERMAILQMVAEKKITAEFVENALFSRIGDKICGLGQIVRNFYALNYFFKRLQGKDLNQFASILTLKH